MPPKGAVRRPAARPVRLRRPAAAVVDVPPVVREDYRRVSRAEWLTKGLSLFRGRYWEEQASWTGVVESLVLQDAEPHLRVKVDGTDNERLLKFLSGREDRLLLVHLCDHPCPALIWGDGICHLEQVEAIPAAPPQWGKNLLPVGGPGGRGEDELQALREDQERLERLKEEAKKREEEKESKKEKKKRKKRSSSSSSRKKKVRVRAKKELSVVFGQTGLDPDQRVRRRFRRKAQKLMRRAKRSRISRTSRSSGSSSSSGGSKDARDAPLSKEKLFSEESVVTEVSEVAPGTLTASWVETAREHLVQSRGEREEGENGPIPPLATKYMKQVLMDRMAPAMRREAGNISKALDLILLQGRICESADVLTQRLKSLEMLTAGMHYTIANRVELLPADRSLTTSSMEALEAAKRVNAEEKLVHKTTKPVKPWDGGGQTKGGGKSSKGDGKKGKGRDSKGKTDGKNPPRQEGGGAAT